MDDDRYLRLSDLAAYSTLSIRTIRRYLAHATHPLPVHRIGGRVLVRKSEFDRWLCEHDDQAVDMTEDARRVAESLRGYVVKG